jgi:predicted MFS family arabinose efflux permease
VSILAIAVIKANLIPNRLTAFGVEIDHVKHQELVMVLTAIVLYFLLVFVAYAYSDFLGWRIAFWEARRASAVAGAEAQKAMDEGADENSPEVSECYRRQRALSEKAIPTSAVRAILDFLLPVLVGVAALMVLRGCA